MFFGVRFNFAERRWVLYTASILLVTLIGHPVYIIASARDLSTFVPGRMLVRWQKGVQAERASL